MISTKQIRSVDKRRVIIFLLSVFILTLVYFFQRLNYLGFLSSLLKINNDYHPYTTFVFNKTLRVIVNDLACGGLIFAIFKDKKYLQVGLLVFAVELIVILPIYFFVKLSLEGDSEISSPLLSQIHRLIVNPMLMILLMIAFGYQRFMEKSNP